MAVSEAVSEAAKGVVSEAVSEAARGAMRGVAKAGELGVVAKWGGGSSVVQVVQAVSVGVILSHRFRSRRVVNMILA